MAAQINATGTDRRMDLFIFNNGIRIGGARPPQLYDWGGHGPPGPPGSYATGASAQRLTLYFNRDKDAMLLSEQIFRSLERNYDIDK